MIFGTFRPRTPADDWTPRLPDGPRVYAVGDIHGRLDLLDDLLDRIARDDAARGAADTILIFLGDLIDRGPQSAQVIDRLMDLARGGPATHFLTGNHEEVFTLALDGNEQALRMLCRIGGRETILSYGLSEEEFNRLDYHELADRLSAIVPAEHRAFLAGFADMVRIGDYVFVHAGIRPGRALEDQRTDDLRWMRNPFLKHRGAHEAMVVHGHTITPEVDERPNRIGIDTGAFSSGRLTALGLQGDDRWFLQTEPDDA